MPRIGSVSPRSVTAVLDLGGDEPLTVTYKPNAIVTAQQVVAEADTTDDAAESRNILAQQLSGLLTSWDAKGPVPDEDLVGFATAKMGEIVAEDQPIPLDPDTLSWLGVPVLKGVILEIVKHSGEYPKGSPNGSPRPGPTPTSTPSN